VLRVVFVLIRRPFAYASARVDGAARPVEVAAFEREEFRRAQAGRRREHDHRSEHAAELAGDGVEFSPGLERPLLWEPAQRIVDASLGGVDVGSQRSFSIVAGAA
jgi:hypothetical protein